MRVLICAMIALMIFGCSSATPTGPEAALALIEESAASIGGWPAMDAIKGQEIITGGSDWEPLQSMEPEGQARQINTFGQTVLIDFESRKTRVTFDGMRTFPAPGPVKFTEVIDGDTAMVQTTDAQGMVLSERLHPSRFVARLRDLNRLPLRILYVAKAAADLTRVDDRVIDGRNYHILTYKDELSSVEVQIEAFNKLPARVIYLEDDPIYGDTLNELVFSDWRQAGDIRLPYTYEVFLNGKKFREERIRTLINNPRYEEDSFAIPDDVRAQPENGERILSQWAVRRAVMGLGHQDFGREQRAVLTEVAPGVHHITGSTHNSMVVEMADHLVVVEAPLYEERSLAVIRALEEKFPGKPIRYVVNTHYHIDHSGGIRTYASKGATIVTHESNVQFVNDMLNRPRTFRPDELARAGGNKAAVESVTDTKTLTDGQRTVELRQVPNPHSAAMLVAYLPAERLLFVSDLYTPNPDAPVDAANPNLRALYAAIAAANLMVDRVVGGHGGVGPYRNVARAMETPLRGS
jgi:glyoxylase-like metal-dependent hydrolase (beta-lactamase superfamily II)